MESTGSPNSSPRRSPSPSPRPEPMSTFDRIFILFASATASMLTYKSMRPGFFQKGLSFSILAGGSAYAFGINWKCCEKTFREIFNGFDGCSTIGGAGHRWGFGVDHRFPTDASEQQNHDRQTSTTLPGSHGTGRDGTFEERD